MPEILEIEGGLVRRKNVEVTGEYRLEDVLPHLERRVPVLTPVLPRNPVRMARWDESDPNDRRLDLIITLDPAIRTLDFDNLATDDNGEIIPCRLAIPWTVFVLHLRTDRDTNDGIHWSMRDVSVYFSKERIVSPDQMVIPAILPNVYEDGQVCWGTTGVDAAQPLPDRIDELVNNWYISRFTDHHVRDRDWPWHSRYYKRWARETAEKGLAAYEGFPEWDPETGYARHFRLGDVFGHNPRTDQVVLPDGIPPLNFTPTFGRAEEWLRELSPTQRFRLRAALANIEVETPDAFAEPVPEDDEEDEDF